MVPAVSNRISRVPPYSGYHYLLSAYVYGAITRFDQTFQTVPLHINSNIVVLQPQNCLNNSGLGCSPFDRHYLGNHYCFLFLRLMRCFSSPGLPPDCSGYQLALMGCPIRKSADRFVFANPHGLSQLITSFFASESQGILRTPLLIFFRILSYHALRRGPKKFLSFVICFQYVKDRLNKPPDPLKGEDRLVLLLWESNPSCASVAFYYLLFIIDPKTFPNGTINHKS
jgi:hypothetical protein